MPRSRDPVDPAEVHAAAGSRRNLAQSGQVASREPLLACAASPNSLWAPNHKIISIAVAIEFTDALSGPFGFTLDATGSDERDQTSDGDDLPNDIQQFVVGTPDTEGLYLIDASAEDRSGTRNEGPEFATVIEPEYAASPITMANSGPDHSILPLHSPASRAVRRLFQRPQWDSSLEI